MRTLTQRDVDNFIEGMTRLIADRRDNGLLTQWCDRCYSRFAIMIADDGRPLCGMHAYHEGYGEKAKHKRIKNLRKLDIPLALADAISAFKSNSVATATTREKKWKTSKGETKSCCVLDYSLHDGKRHLVHINNIAVRDELMNLFEAREEMIATISLARIKEFLPRRQKENIADSDVARWKAAYDALRELGIKI